MEEEDDSDKVKEEAMKKVDGENQVEYYDKNFNKIKK